MCPYLHTSHSNPMSWVSTLSLQVLHTSILSTNHTFSMGLSWSFDGPATLHPPSDLSFFRWSLLVFFVTRTLPCSLSHFHSLYFPSLDLCHLYLRFNIAPSAILPPPHYCTYMVGTISCPAGGNKVCRIQE